MSLQGEFAIAGLRLGVPVVIGAVVGGFGLYFAVDAACKSFQESPWISGVVGALAGSGVGFMVSQMIR